MKLLEQALLEGWSVEKLGVMSKSYEYQDIEEIESGEKEEIIDDHQPVPVKPKLSFCIVCRKWYVDDPNLLCDTRGYCEEKTR